MQILIKLRITKYLMKTHLQIEKPYATKHLALNAIKPHAVLLY